MAACWYVHKFESPEQLDVLDHLELEVQATGSHLTWVLETGVLWAISPDPKSVTFNSIFKRPKERVSKNKSQEGEEGKQDNYGSQSYIYEIVKEKLLKKNIMVKTLTNSNFIH